MQQLFLIPHPQEEGTGDSSFTSFGLAFSLHKAEVNVSVCRGEGTARSVVVSTTACAGGSSSLRISPLCAMKGFEKSVI